MEHRPTETEPFAPGINGITYVTFKKCRSVFLLLCKIFRRVWTTGAIPLAWTLAEIILISKSEILDQPKEFRPISLLNITGKIFFSEVNRRIERFMVDNGYLNRAIQKGFVSGVPGCLEHTAKLSEAFRVAKETKRPICVSFIDLENAYGSVKHNHIQYAFTWYHFPAAFRKLMFNYYESQHARVRTDDWTTDWFKSEIGCMLHSNHRNQRRRHSHVRRSGSARHSSNYCDC